jgi:hypothetical protein
MPITKATQNVIATTIPNQQTNISPLNGSWDGGGTFSGQKFSPNGSFLNGYPIWSFTNAQGTYTYNVNSSLNNYEFKLNGTLIGTTDNSVGLLNSNPTIGTVITQKDGANALGDKFYITLPGYGLFGPSAGRDADLNTVNENIGSWQYSGVDLTNYALEDHEHPYGFGFFKIISLYKTGTYTNRLNFSFTDDLTTPAFFVNHLGSATGDQYIVFTNNTTTVGRITKSATGVAYGTTSDYRLKENISPIDNALSKINSINPVEFNFKSDEDKTKVTGFIAHEIQEIIPQAVIGAKDAEEEIDQQNEDGTIEKVTKIVPQMIDYSSVIPVLVKAVQELSAEVASLKAQLNP